MKTDDKVMITVRMTPEEKAKLVAIAEKRGFSYTVAIRQWIKGYKL